MKSENTNLLTSIIVVILSAFAASGLAGIDPTATATDIANEIAAQNWVGIGLIVITAGNAFIHWFRQLKEDPSLFWQFLRSRNWWVTFATFAFAVYTFFFGVQIDPAAADAIVDAAVNQDWVNLIVIILMNLVNPLISKTVKKPDATVIKIGSALKRVA